MSSFKTSENELVIPQSLEELSFDDFVVSEKDPEEKQRAKRIVELIARGDERVKDLNGLWLWGTNGTGKTLLQAILHNELKARGKSVSWISPTEEKSTIYNTFGGMGGDKHNVKETLFDSDYIFIDEVTLQGMSAGSVAAFRTFITQVYERKDKIRLICSANHSISDVSIFLQEESKVVSTDQAGNVTGRSEMSGLVTNKIEDRLRELCTELDLRYESYRTVIQRKQKSILDDL